MGLDCQRAWLIGRMALSVLGEVAARGLFNLFYLMRLRVHREDEADANINMPADTEARRGSEGHWLRVAPCLWLTGSGQE